MVFKNLILGLFACIAASSFVGLVASERRGRLQTQPCSQVLEALGQETFREELRRSLPHVSIVFDFQGTEPSTELDRFYRSGKIGDVRYVQGEELARMQKLLKFPGSIVAKTLKYQQLLEMNEGHLKFSASVFSKFANNALRLAQLEGPKFLGLAVGTDGRVYILSEFISAPSLFDIISSGNLRSDHLRAYDRIVVDAFEGRRTLGYGYAVSDMHFGNVKVLTDASGRTLLRPFDVRLIPLSYFKDVDPRTTRITHGEFDNLVWVFALRRLMLETLKGRGVSHDDLEKWPKAYHDLAFLMGYAVVEVPLSESRENFLAWYDKKSGERKSQNSSVSRTLQSLQSASAGAHGTKP